MRQQVAACASSHRAMKTARRPMRLPDLRALLRRFTADQSMRIRRRDERFELHERIFGDWRLRGFYSSYEDAEKKAEDLIRQRKRAT